MREFFSKIKHKKFIMLMLLVVPLFIMLGILVFNNNYIKNDNRVTDGYHEVHEVNFKLIEDDTAPQGVIKCYSMTIDEFHTNANCFAFYVVHHYAHVYIEDVLVYSFYPSNVGNVGDTLGCDWVIVPIIQEDEGKVITVELTPIYRDVVDYEITFLHGAQYDIFIDVLAGDLVWLIVGIGCLCVGIVLIFGHINAKHHHRAHDKSFIYLGLIAVLIAFWRVFDLDLAPIFFNGNPRFLFYMSYTSLMLVPLPFIKYVQCLLKNKNCFALDLVYVIYYSVCAVALTLQVCNLVDVRTNITLLIVIMSAAIVAVSIIIMIKGDFLNRRHESIKQMLPLFLSILSIGAILDMIIYLVQGTTKNLMFTFISFFVYALIVVINSLSENDKKVYRDFQTGLYNSNSCTEHLKEFANLKHCAVMMFDLNGLKYTNDNFGHDAGDRLIIDLTEVLKKSIPVDNFIGRYGGDEFIAVIRNCNSDKIKKIVDNLEKHKEEINVDRLPTLSFSYGWALSDEYEGQLSDLLKIADKFMYEHKNLQRQSGEIQ